MSAPKALMKSWVETITSLKTIYDGDPEPSAPSPNMKSGVNTYAAINFMSDSSGYGTTYEETSDDTGTGTTVNQYRSKTRMGLLDVAIYGPGAYDYCRALDLSLGRQDVADLFSQRAAADRFELGCSAGARSARTCSTRNTWRPGPTTTGSLRFPARRENTAAAAAAGSCSRDNQPRAPPTCLDCDSECARASASNGSPAAKRSASSPSSARAAASASASRARRYQWWTNRRSPLSGEPRLGPGAGDPIDASAPPSRESARATNIS